MGSALAPVTAALKPVIKRKASAIPAAMPVLPGSGRLALGTHVPCWDRRSRQSVRGPSFQGPRSYEDKITDVDHFRAFRWEAGGEIVKIPHY